MFRNTQHIHFIGIGGIGMSGMAELLHKLGFNISGSDNNQSERTDYLESLGLKIKLMHKDENILKCDVVVYSSAISSENIELLAAKEKNIPIIRRAEMLAELLKVKETSIAVSGTHGKTTTSSLLGSILTESKLDPTLVIGGIVNKFNTNAISGKGDLIVVEADEFDRSFLTLQPTLSVINNLDLEHLDCYKNLKDLQNTFIEFGNKVPFYGIVALGIDSKNIRAIVNKIKKPIVTYGIVEDAIVKAKNLIFNNNHTEFELFYKNKLLGNIKLNIPGEHNVLNALGAISIALELNVSFENICNGLKSYRGVRRRFEITDITNNDVMIVDDYAHHPSEVSATLKAAKKGWGRRIIAIFQPHLFTRTRDFYKDFAKSFMNADLLFISDIYGAREEPIDGITSQIIIDECKNQGHTKVYYAPDIEKISNLIISHVNANDMIITMGAGNVWRQCKTIACKINNG